MPGASLVAAVVSPDILESLPGDKEVFFGMLHLECGTSCSETDGIWLLQGQWSQVKEAVMLLDIVEKAKSMNKPIIDRAFFHTDPASSENESAQVLSHLQPKFIVEWTDFFNDIHKEFSRPAVEKFKKIATAALRKEEETKCRNESTRVPTRRALTRRKGLPHRLRSTVVENPLVTALAIAFEGGSRNDASNGNQSQEIAEDNLSVGSVDSVDIQQAMEETADEEFTLKRTNKKANKESRRFKKQSKPARIEKRSAEILNKMVRELQPEFSPVIDNLGSQSGDNLQFAATDTVFPIRSEDDHSIVDLTRQQNEVSSSSQVNNSTESVRLPIFRCPVCSTFTAESRGKIKIHAYAHHLATSYRCFVCKATYGSKLALERHRVSHRKETFPYLRCLCSRILTSRSGLTRHIVSCKSLTIGAKLIDDPRAADEMNEKIPPYVTYNENGHPKKAAGRPPTMEQFACDICNNFYAPSGPKLVHHKLTKHRDEALKCLSCPTLTFKDFAEFYDHNSMHVTKLPCEQCGKTFSNARSYDQHLRTHEGRFEKSAFVCTICAKAFATAYVLKYHMQHSHLNMGRRFQCSRCNRAFSQKIHLIEHLYSHDGLKPYMCDICGKGFSHQTSLQQHKLTHGDETRYKCEECPKSFRTRASLVMHRNCHTERKHQCQFCGKLFTQKTARIRHERIHTGEQPFKCTQCSKAFSDSSVLRRHLLTHDPNHAAKRQNLRKGADLSNIASSAVDFASQMVGEVVDLTSSGRKSAVPKGPGNARRKTKNNAPPAEMAVTSSSTAFALPQAPPLADTALDLHLFSPMSILVNQPQMEQPAQMGHDLMGSEVCRSPETPPPISVPEHSAAMEESRSLYETQPQNLTFSQSQRTEQPQTTQPQQQPYIIQLPPEAVQVIQVPSTSASSRQPSSKFTSYLQHQERQLDSMADDTLPQSVLCNSASGTGTSDNGAGSSHHPQQMYSLGSLPPTTSIADLLSSNPGTAIQPVFFSSDLLGSGSGALFAVSAEAVFGSNQAGSAQATQAGQQTHHQPASCSYQFGDMGMVDSQSDQQQQQQPTSYQPSSLFANMDGTPIAIHSLNNIFSEQFGDGNGRPGAGGHQNLAMDGDVGLVMPSTDNLANPAQHVLLPMPPQSQMQSHTVHHRNVNDSQYHQ